MNYEETVEMNDLEELDDWYSLKEDETIERNREE